MCHTLGKPGAYGMLGGGQDLFLFFGNKDSKQCDELQILISHA